MLSNVPYNTAWNRLPYNLVTMLKWSIYIYIYNRLLNCEILYNSDVSKCYFVDIKHDNYVVNLKYVFWHFHLHVAMKPFCIWTEWKHNPHLHDIVNICLEFQSSIHIHYKVTGLQIWKNYTLRDFCSEMGPTVCHENNCNWKTIWSRKPKFWICSFG